MAENNLNKIEKTVWYDAGPLSPQMPPDTFGIDFEIAPAQGPNGPTVGLYGVSELTGAYGDLYGGRIPGAMEVIAINVSTGAVYHGRPERIDSAPLIVVPNQSEPDSSEMVLGSVITHFNIDLCEQLALPAEQANYNVFVWLDDCISAVKTVAVPANSLRQGRAVTVQQKHFPEIIQFRSSPHSPKAVPQKTILSLPQAAQAQPLLETGTLIYGQLHPDDLADTSPVGDDPQPILNLFVRGVQDRRLQWVTHVLDEAVWRNKSGAFDFDPLRLIAHKQIGEQYYLLACYLDSVSNIIKFSPA